MSGGGYRAAAFHLGALSYLDRVGLRESVSAISTVSGGTFTGARYIVSLVEKQCFSKFFKDYYHELKCRNLVKDGLEELASGESTVASGRQDLVVSMAQVYANVLFSRPGDEQQAREPYYFDTILYGDQPVDEVVFNATDFRSGIAFRFQRSSRPEAMIGNYYNHIDAADAAKIRLSDIVAASSCFPGGFEPISFPYDFTWQGHDIPEAVARAFPCKPDHCDSGRPQGPVALMDGGVYDNQGLQSLLMADQRTGNKLDLLIISDVDQPSIDLYDMPKHLGNGGLTLGTVHYLALFTLLLCVITIGAIGYHVWRDWSGGDLLWEQFLFIYLIPFSITTFAAGSICYLYSIIRDDILPAIPKVRDRAWHSLRQVTTGQLRNMIRLRLTSLLTLTSSIFMKRIRTLVYQKVYDQDQHGYARITISNLIYSLAPSKTRGEPIRGIAAPSKLLNQVACVAFNQPTTLWFDRPFQEPCLIAAGQASMCYNLIKHFIRRYGEEPASYPSTILAKWLELEKDWHCFNEDPFFSLKCHVEECWPEICSDVEKAAETCNWGMFEGKTAQQSQLE
jgi:hypothetical protein